MNNSQIDLIKYIDSLQISQDSSGIKFIFDPIRRKHLILQPEEIVRQCCIQYLLVELKYPLRKLQVEKQIEVFGKKRRFDIIGYNQENKLNLLVECKSFSTPINNDVATQIAIYNTEFLAEHLWITNGKDNYFFIRKDEQYLPLEGLSTY